MAQNKDFQQVRELYTQLKATRDRAKPIWDDISRFVGINTQPNYAYNRDGQATATDQLDKYVDDPTAAINVNQAGDYMVGIMWGTGEGVMNLIPSRYVKELVDEQAVKPFYDFATDQTLYHMNHAEAGYTSALRPYAYDQVAFGTSGIGIFPNKGFEMGDENALIARQYGVDNVVIDEGKSGLVDYVFATYNWRVNRIVGEFCMVGGKLDEQALAKMPKAVQDAYKRKDANMKFDVVFGMMPRDDYDPKSKGAKGTRYRGVWFMDTNDSSGFFMEEDFAKRPINIARMIRIRGEVWGRASGTMLISSIRSVNYMIGTTIEVMEKMADPALGMFSNAIFGDSVLDTSPSGLTIFNSTLAAASGGNPTFKLFDVGDPTALIQFLVPYLNEKITTAFKVDTLLDFASNKEMTATESMQRYVIRGQSLSGVLTQQKNERLIPDVERAVSILLSVGELGVNPQTDRAKADALRQRRPERIIPDAVLKCIAMGKPWFEIQFNNEMEKLIRTDRVKNLLQVLQSVGAIAQLYPEIVLAVDWYRLLKDINDNLDANSQILMSEVKFKDAVAKIDAAKAQAAAMQAGQVGAATAKDATTANKNQAQVKAIGAGNGQ